MKENLRFKQLRLNYTSNQQQKRTPKISKKIRVGAAAKTDDKIYFLSTIKIYSYLSIFFSTVPKKFELLKISKVM